MTSLRILWQVHLLHLHVYNYIYMHCTCNNVDSRIAPDLAKAAGILPPPSPSSPSSPLPLLSLLSLPPLPPSSPSLLSLPPLPPSSPSLPSPPSPPLPPFPSLLSPSPQSYVFPGMTVINKAMAPLENTTLLTSQYFLCQGMLYACFNER